MNRLLLLMAFLSFLCFSTISRAQTLSGKITDAETHQPLEAVMISVLRRKHDDRLHTDRCQRAIFSALET